MSKRARNRPDKRAQAFALACSDAPFPLGNGGTYDPRAPWQLPGKEDPEPPPPRDPWGYEPSKRPIPIGPTDVAPHRPQL